MDGLIKGLPRALPERHDLRIVSPSANRVREVVRPLMQRSFTRRLTVWAYELVSAHPTLPGPAPRAAPDYVVLDPARFRLVENHGIRGGGARPDVIDDTATGARYIFKGGDAALLTLPRRGIDGPTQPIRAVASAIVLEAFGVATPRVDLVEFAGRRGSLQAFIPDTIDLPALRRADRARFDATVRSQWFAEQRSDMWMGDCAIGSLDRQSHNILLPRAAEIQRIYGIDQDLAWSPSPDMRPLRGVHIYLPNRVRYSSYERLRGYVADPGVVLDPVAHLLTKYELDAAATRMTAALAVIDRTIAKRGAETVFFANESPQARAA